MNTTSANFLQRICLDPKGNTYFFRWAKRKYKRIWAAELGKLGLRGKALLDAGCGEGIVFEVFAKLGLAKVVGIDYSADPLVEAKKEADRLKAQCKFELMQGNLEDLSQLQSSSFDCVFSNGVLLCLNNPEAAVKEFHRITKAGGYAMVSGTDLGNMYHSRFAGFPGIDHYVTEKQIKLFENCGYKMLKRRKILYFGYTGNTFPKGFLVSLTARAMPPVMAAMDLFTRAIGKPAAENVLIFQKLS